MKGCSEVIHENLKINKIIGIGSAKRSTLVIKLPDHRLLGAALVGWEDEGIGVLTVSTNVQKKNTGKQQNSRVAHKGLLRKVKLDKIMSVRLCSWD